MAGKPILNESDVGIGEMRTRDSAARAMRRLTGGHACGASVAPISRAEYIPAPARFVSRGRSHQPLRRFWGTPSPSAGNVTGDPSIASAGLRQCGRDSVSKQVAAFEAARNYTAPR